jgi:hypothetical protein
MTILNMPFHMKSVQILESSKFGDEFVGISYSSKYFEELPKNIIFTIACRGNTHASRLGTQIIALKHARMGFFVFFVLLYV